MNTNQHLRSLLAKWQQEDGAVAGKGGLGDPPLLELEIEAAAAEVQLLKSLSGGEHTEEMQAQAWAQLLQACSAVLQRFESPASAVHADGAPPKPVRPCPRFLWCMCDACVSMPMWRPGGRVLCAVRG